MEASTILGIECEELPQKAIENGKALTAAMMSGTNRFTTALLTSNLRDLLQSLENEQSEGKAGDNGAAKAKGGRKRPGGGGYNNWANRWAREGDELFVGSDDDEDVDIQDRNAAGDAQQIDGADEANVEEDKQAPAVTPSDDVKARRARVKELVGELVDILIR